MRWKVVAETTGTPAAVRTKPPEPDAPGSQSPTPAVGTLAWRLPSIAKPPVGGETTAVPEPTAPAVPARNSDSKQIDRIASRRARGGQDEIVRIMGDPFPGQDRDVQSAAWARARVARGSLGIGTSGSFVVGTTRLRSESFMLSMAGG